MGQLMVGGGGVPALASIQAPKWFGLQVGLIDGSTCRLRPTARLLAFEQAVLVQSAQNEDEDLIANLLRLCDYFNRLLVLSLDRSTRLTPRNGSRRDRSRPRAGPQPLNHDPLNGVPLAPVGIGQRQGLVHHFQQLCQTGGFIHERPGSDRRAYVELVSPPRQQNQWRAASLLQQTVGNLPRAL